MADARGIGEAGSTTGNPVLERIARTLNVLCNGALYLAGTGLAVMSCIVFWQVFCRYVLNWSNSWTEITAVLLMSWFIFLGAAVGVRENYHLGFDVLLYVLPKGGKRYLRSLSDIVVAAFSAGMIIYGIQLVKLQWPAVMPALGITEGIRYFPLVGGGALILLFSLERLVMRFAGYEVDRDLHDVPEIEVAKDA